MELISTNLNTYYPEVVKALKDRNPEFIRKTAAAAEKAGADYIEVGAPNGPSESEELKWLVSVTQDACDLPLVICWDGCRDLADVLKTVKKPGIINGICTQETADIILPLFKDLPEGWRLVLNACAKKGQEDPGSRIEEYAPLMRQAEEAGLMPERIIIDPCAGELKTNPNAYLDMEDAMDAFTNVYPESSFVCEPFMITSGLANPDPLKAAFVTMALSIGISMMKADVFDPKIREAFFAAQALLDEGDGLKGYQESLK